MKFVVKNADNIVFETFVHLELHDIRWFYDEFKVDIASGTTWRAEVEAIYQQVNQGGYQSESNDYFLFVHGWNVTAAEKKRWAETIFKRFWWQGYKGQVGFFNWPCLLKNVEMDFLFALTDPNNFNNSEFLAWQSAESLSRLLRELKVQNGKKLTMLAHSQGNVVAGEALSKYDSSPIDTYIASQAALSSSFYDNHATLENVPTTGFLKGRALPELIDFDKRQFILKTPRIFGQYPSGVEPDPYFSHADHTLENKVRKIYNFYNKDDWALRQDSWELNNVMRPAYGMKFIHCDTNDQNGQYDIFEQTECPTEDSQENERFINRYIETGDGDEGDYVVDELDVVNGTDLERYAIFSYIAHSRTRALGTQDVKGSGFTGDNVNLANEDMSTTLRFNDKHYSHSRQFRSNIINENWYWDRVMEQSCFGSSIKK